MSQRKCLAREFRIAELSETLSERDAGGTPALPVTFELD